MTQRKHNLTRRSMRGIGLAALVAACTDPVATQQTTAAGLVPAQVSVDVSAIQGITGREFVRSPQQIQSDVSAALAQQIPTRTAGNADVRIALREVRLTSPGNAVAFGGRSRIVALVQILDVRTGAPLRPTKEITGFADQIRPGGLIGAALTPSAQADYDQTLRGFASTVAAQLSAGDTAT